MGEKLPRIFPKVTTSTSLLVSFTCRKFTTWDRRLYFHSEGRRAGDFLFFGTYVRKFLVLLKSKENKFNLHEAQYTFMILYRSFILRMRNVSDKNCRENRNKCYTH